jgi:hypothetical protein
VEVEMEQRDTVEVAGKIPAGETGVAKSVGTVIPEKKK